MDGGLLPEYYLVFDEQGNEDSHGPYRDDHDTHPDRRIPGNEPDWQSMAYHPFTDDHTCRAVDVHYSLDLLQPGLASGVTELSEDGNGLPALCW